MRRSRKLPPNVHKPMSGPPTAIKIEPPKIDNDGLRAAYEWLVIDKIVALKLAFEWYAANTPALLFGDPLDESRQKTYDRANKSKNIGDSTDMVEEKDAAYGTAIKLYEKVWASRNLLTLGDALTTITEVSPRVEAVQTVLDSMNAAFKGVVTFRMTLNKDREYLRGEILVPKAELEALVPQTPLKIALSEVPTVAKALSIVDVDVTDEAGNVTRQQKLDGAAFMKKLPTLLDGVAVWASGDKSLASKAIGRAIHPIKAATPINTNPLGNVGAPKAPRATPTYRVNTKGTITVIDASKVPYQAAAKKRQVLTLCVSKSRWTVADFFAELKKITGSPCTMRSFALQTLTMSGAISVS